MRGKIKRTKVKRLHIYDGKTTASVFVRWRNATRPVDVPLKFAEEFVMSSKQGSSWQCLLARGGMAAAKASPKLFPHPVLYVHVLGSTLFIIHKQPQRPGAHYWAIRYDHNFTGTLRKYDQYSQRQFLEEFGDKEIVVRLTPPRIHGTPGVRGERYHGPGPDARKVVRHPSQGALRRAQDAGLVPP